MVPWDMLPKDLQKAILAMIILYGGTRVCSGPMVCDPQPPPTTTPMICDPPPPPSRTATPPPTRTPMICDPLPPTRTATPTPSRTPMICDPAPIPSIVPGDLTPSHFQVSNLQTSSNPSVQGAVIKGVVRDQQGKPLMGQQVTAQGAIKYLVMTGNNGEYVLNILGPGNYRVIVAGDLAHALQLDLKSHDVITIEWVEVKATSQNTLPLAEIRTVDLVWDEALTFAADTPWPDARLRWSVSGGTLVEEDERVTWQPPVEPGRYLLQVVADWGRAGLAVDALTLTVEKDGGVTIG